jgi:putative peptidoglycan lipid II flippase
MLSTLTSRILGFVRLALIGMFFGGEGQADVFHLVFSIPNNLRKLLAEGALSSAFIPVATKANLEDLSFKRTGNLARNLIGFQLLVLLPLLLVSTLFPGEVTSLLVPFTDPAQKILAAELFQYVIYYILFISVSAVLMGILNSHLKFIVPALAPLMFSVSVISALIIFVETLGIFAMAVGVLGGGLLQILIQTPQYAKFGHSIIPRFKFSESDFKDVIGRWLPVLFSSAIFFINQQIAVAFASGLEAGSGSALSNALVFWQLPFGIFSASITTVLYPRMSKDLAQGEMGKLTETINYGIRGLISFLIPSMILLFSFAAPIIAIALQSGEFKLIHSIFASEVLGFYLIGLFSVGLNNFLQRLFYSSGDKKTPVINGLIILVLDVTLSIILKETALRVRGLALANSLAFSVGAIFLLIRSKRILGRFPGEGAIKTFFKVILAILPALGIFLGSRLINDVWWQNGRSLENLVILFALGLVAVAVTLGLFIVLKVEAVQFLRRK